KLHRHCTHGQKMLHAPESWQQVKPGTMKRGSYDHEMCLPWQGPSKNATKTFIVRHFSNAVMVHNNGQVWLWSPAHLNPRHHIPIAASSPLHKRLQRASPWYSGFGNQPAAEARRFV